MKKVYVTPRLSLDIFRVPMCYNFENRVRSIIQQLNGILKDKFYFEVPESVPLLEVYDYLRKKSYDEFFRRVFS